MTKPPFDFRAIEDKTGEPTCGMLRMPESSSRVEGFKKQNVDRNGIHIPSRSMTCAWFDTTKWLHIVAQGRDEVAHPGMVNGYKQIR